jgi:hypothetical protein
VDIQSRRAFKAPRYRCPSVSRAKSGFESRAPILGAQSRARNAINLYGAAITPSRRAEATFAEATVAKARRGGALGVGPQRNQ